MQIYSQYGPSLNGPDQNTMWHLAGCDGILLTGRGPTGLRARLRNRGRLENQSHMVLKTAFQDGANRNPIFTHKIMILA